MSKTLLRTDQLDKTFRQTFNNLSGLQPIFDFNFNGLSTGGQTLWQAVIEKSPFTNKNIPITSDTQALVNITNKDDTFNRASLWLKYDKPTTPADWAVKGILHQARNDVVNPIGNLFVVQPVSSTSAPMAVWYLETGGPTANARPFYAQDVRAFDGTTTFNSTGWIGYTSYFKSTGAIGFRAFNRGTNSDPIGFLAYVQTQPEDVTGVAKFGYVCRLDRSASASSPSYLIGYRVNIVDSVGSTTYYNSGFEVGVFTPNVSTVSGSTGFKVFGTGNIQNFTGFSFSESSFSNPANNVGFAVGIKSSSSIGMSIFFGSSISSGFVRGIFCNTLPGNTYNTSQFSAFYWSNLNGTWGNTEPVVGFYNSCGGIFNGSRAVIGFFNYLSSSGTISDSGAMYGILLSVDNATINGTYTGIRQTITPASVRIGASIKGHEIQLSNLDGSFHSGCEVIESGTLTFSESTLFRASSNCVVNSIQTLYSGRFEGTSTGTIYGNYIDFGLATISGGIVYGCRIDLGPIDVSAPSQIIGTSIYIGQKAIENASSTGIDIYFGNSTSGYVNGVHCRFIQSNTLTDSSSFYKISATGTVDGSGDLTGFRNEFSGVFNGTGKVIGFCNKFSGTSSRPLSGILLEVHPVGSAVNNNYIGIEQNITPGSIGSGVSLIGYSVFFNDLATTATECVGYKVLAGQNIASNFGLGMIFGKLGTATDSTVYNSFTTRWTSSNWDTGVSEAVSNDWDARAIGVSGDPPNSRLGIFRDGNELFNIQRLGDIEVITADKGIILKSPNGTRYRVKVDNAGGLVTEAV